METITPPTAGSNPAPPHRSRVPDRPLWSAPVFVVGVAALVAAWYCRPLWSVPPAKQLARDLEAVRQLLSRHDGDVEQALKLALRALDASAVLPERTGEAALLVGTAHIRLAERTDPARAAERWEQARKYLD